MKRNKDTPIFLKTVLYRKISRIDFRSIFTGVFILKTRSHNSILNPPNKNGIQEC